MPRAHDIEILTIGDELLRGEIVDTNSTWLAERLTDLGGHVRWKSSVTDGAEDMMAAIALAAGRAAIVVCSGGLGPTEDDRTVDVVAKVLGVGVENDAVHEQRMRERFASRGFKLTENNLRQIRVPVGAEVLANTVGIAPGFAVTIGDTLVAFMPGVPREMKAIFDAALAPVIKARLGESSTVTARRTFRTVGMGESHVDTALAKLLEGIADATVHYRIAFPEVLVTVVTRAATAAAANVKLDLAEQRARAALAHHLYATGDEPLAQAVGKKLQAAGATLATAESCTGGLVGQLLTAIAGSSAYYRGGVVTYSDDLKHSLLGVREETLKAHGAVSRECAIEMAEGARQRLNATYALSVTGIAGPTGGSETKPIGTVEIALAGPRGTEHRHIRGFGDREQVRFVGAYSALHLLYKELTR
jgi:nicotinamide-nucleotide amidase